MSAIRTLLALLAVFLLAGCRQPEPTPTDTVRIQLAYETEPVRVGQAALVVTLTDAAGQPIADAQVSVRGDMTHAGMVPVLGEGQPQGDGRYRVPFEWTMSGDWFVEVTAVLPNGVTARQRFDLTVSR